MGAEQEDPWAMRGRRNVGWAFLGSPPFISSSRARTASGVLRRHRNNPPVVLRPTTHPSLRRTREYSSGCRGTRAAPVRGSKVRRAWPSSAKFGTLGLTLAVSPSLCNFGIYSFQRLFQIVGYFLLT